MKSRIPYAIAALLAAGGISLAFAQKDQDRAVDTQANANAPSTMSDANVPNTRPDVTSTGAAAAGKKPNPAPPIDFVQEPVARPSGQGGSQDPVVASIVNALNADPSLQHSKISVQSDQGTVVLTGVALTQAQKKQAVQIAASRTGPTKVVDAIQSDDV
jgi:hypothetical protein